MADSPNTTNLSRVSFSSAGAVRRRPFPQLETAPRLPTGIQINWANLLDNLAGIAPPELIGLAADADDINRRANHLQQVLDAVTSYVRAVVGDTAYRASCHIHDETGFLADASADIVGELRKNAEALRIEVNPGAWLKARQAEVAR
jgi:hypothetical protein